MTVYTGDQCRLLVDGDRARFEAAAKTFELLANAAHTGLQPHFKSQACVAWVGNGQATVAIGERRFRLSDGSTRPVQRTVTWDRDSPIAWFSRLHYQLKDHCKAELRLQHARRLEREVRHRQRRRQARRGLPSELASLVRLVKRHGKMTEVNLAEMERMVRKIRPLTEIPQDVRHNGFMPDSSGGH
jgi:hypothetical protein